ncbi:hypothetical protein EDC02_0893 [Micromonospora sp. Llam0]|uniref:hypothetical protein n=1 Tax=Micromonospora sp. Llam0 TaxID=2485143 RepID=UPI000F4875EE|nr:hypothetical protein [Micromonospora sp. Llam0]ROO59107.1 hypothetical protein EDC02_0893 [Micromonospora sp. Llam0]
MARAEGAPVGSRYVDQRHYLVPARMTDLRGPVGGVVTLDRWLDWSSDSVWQARFPELAAPPRTLAG